MVMALAKEIRKLSQEPLDGIKVALNEDDVADINAEISGPGARSAHRPHWPPLVFACGCDVLC